MMMKIKSRILLVSWIFTVFFSLNSFSFFCANAEPMPPELEFSLRTVLLSINSSVDPCTDFYGFACGAWAKNNFPIKDFLPPATDTSQFWKGNYVNLFGDRIKAQLRGVLEDRQKSARTVEGIFYQKCLDRDKLYSLGNWPFAKLLMKASNGHQWPVLYPNQEDNRHPLPTWDYLLGTFLFQLDVSPLISLSPFIDTYHQSPQSSQSHQSRLLVQPPQNSERIFIYNSEQIASLMVAWENDKNTLGKVNQNSFVIRQQVEEVLQLQSSLLNVRTTAKEPKEGGMMSLAYLETQTADFPHWTALFSNLLRQAMDQLFVLVNPKAQSQTPFYHPPNSDFHKVHNTLETLRLARQLALSNKWVAKSDPNALKLARLASLLDHAQLEQITVWMNTSASSSSPNSGDNFTVGLSKEKYDSFFREPFSFYGLNEDIFFVDDIGYFRRLVPLLEATPRHVLFNFLSLQAMASWQNYLGGASTRKIFSEPLWKHCVQRTMKVFPWTMSHRYLFLQDPDKLRKIKQKVTSMVETAKGSFEAVIQSAEWLDEDTRKVALDKLRAMAAFVAYPDWLLKVNREEMDWLHRRELLQENSFLSLAVRKVSFDRVWRHLLLYETGRLDASSEPIYLDFIGWQEPPTFGTPYHVFRANAITIPVAILQPPLFVYLEEKDKTGAGDDVHLTDHEAMADLLNIGTLLSSISHELLHGFELVGVFFDRFGHGPLHLLWKPQSLQQLATRSACLARQYRNKQVVLERYEEHRRADGSSLFWPVFRQEPSDKTLREDIADNGSLKVAYNVFQQQWKQKWNPQRGRRRGPFPHHLYISMPSTRGGTTFYSPDQLFFLAHAQYYCQTEVSSGASELSESDPTHSSAQARVNLPVFNLENGVPFSRAFNCPKTNGWSKRYSQIPPLPNSNFRHQNGHNPERCEVW